MAVCALGVLRGHKHVLQAEARTHVIAQVVAGSGDAKISKQNQEWPKNEVSGALAAPMHKHLHASRAQLESGPS